MDFGLSFVPEPSVASQSNIRYWTRQERELWLQMNCPYPPGSLAARLDEMELQAANQAAMDLVQIDPEKFRALLIQEQHAINLQHDRNKPSAEHKIQNGTSAEVVIIDDDQVENELKRVVDLSLYTDRTTPVHNTIQTGDLVVVMESFDRLSFVYATPGAIYSNRNGHFHHNDFLGQPFGTKLRSRDKRGYGFLYLLRPTPELWTRSLPHRTQIVHELDQSQIVFQLYLRPNMKVVESGTGSGAMSHAILRTIAPHGHLYTFEFNANRVQVARQEFIQHGLGRLVTVRHRDVCAEAAAGKNENTSGFIDSNPENGKDSTNDPKIDKGNESMVGAVGGFDLPATSIDAVVLDLPEPWRAIPHAARILKPGARLASYSPCVEQTQRTVQALLSAGFHSIKNMEYRLQEHYVDEVEYEALPTGKRPRVVPHDAAQHATTTDSLQVIDGEETFESALVTMAAEPAVDKATQDDAACKGASEAVKATGYQSLPSDATKPKSKRKKLLVARPFVTMRGHSAYLTFATAGNAVFVACNHQSVPGNQFRNCAPKK